ncbi:hypothetical protein KEM48_000686 [Puccinia striiformis f. sp. tritici PST-130]|nr:hypothetical protein KEM48_000686 [Puccinia striiformis f. sp. tritici PST-130]
MALRALYSSYSRECVGRHRVGNEYSGIPDGRLSDRSRFSGFPRVPALPSSFENDQKKGNLSRVWLRENWHPQHRRPRRRAKLNRHSPRGSNPQSLDPDPQAEK